MKKYSMRLSLSFLLLLDGRIGRAFAAEPSAAQEGEASYYADSRHGQQDGEWRVGMTRPR